VMWFVVRFVQWKLDIGLKEMIRLSTISVGVHLAGFKGLFVGNFPARPETSQQPSSRNNVRGPYMQHAPKTSRPERCRFIFNFIY